MLSFLVPVCTNKSIQAKALTKAIDQDLSEADDSDGSFEITMVQARRKSTGKRRGYEHKVFWHGFMW